MAPWLRKGTALAAPRATHQQHQHLAPWLREGSALAAPRATHQQQHQHLAQWLREGTALAAPRATHQHSLGGAPCHAPSIAIIPDRHPKTHKSPTHMFTHFQNYNSGCMRPIHQNTLQSIQKSSVAVIPDSHPKTHNSPTHIFTHFQKSNSGDMLPIHQKHITIHPEIMYRSHPRQSS